MTSQGPGLDSRNGPRPRLRTGAKSRQCIRTPVPILSRSMEITEEVLDKAVNAFEDYAHNLSWEQDGREAMRAALEAVAPHMIRVEP